MEQLDLFGVPIPKKEEKKHQLKKPAVITIDEPEETQQPEPEKPVEEETIINEIHLTDPEEVNDIEVVTEQAQKAFTLPVTIEENISNDELNEENFDEETIEEVINEPAVAKNTEAPKQLQPVKQSASQATVKQPSKRGRKSLKEISIDVALLDIPEDAILFKKQYYSITTVAEWFRVNPSLLRFWENEFTILKPRKNKKGDRLFRPEDVKNLRIIYYLLRQQKYSIEGAKQYLKDNSKKAEMQTQLVECLTKFRGFLLELRANLGA